MLCSCNNIIALSTLYQSHNTFCCIFTVPPSVQLEVMDRSRVRLGESVTLTCIVVRGNPPSYSIQWYHNGLPIISTSDSSTYSTLVINSVIVSSIGTYECNVLNKAGTESKSIVITMRRKFYYFVTIRVVSTFLIQIPINKFRWDITVLRQSDLYLLIMH